MSKPTLKDCEAKIDPEKMKVKAEREKDEGPEKPSVQVATPEQMASVKQVSVPPKPKPPVDASGAIIPQHLLPLRDRRGEITAMEHWAGKIRSLFERLIAENDPLYGHIRHSGNLDHMMNAAATIRHELAECTPDIVCPRCDGMQNGKPCAYCCGSGWIARVRWDREWVKARGTSEQAVVAKRAANL